MLAASGWPKIPKTPHSSLNLSNIFCSSPSAPGARDFFYPLGQRLDRGRLRHAFGKVAFNRGIPDALRFVNRQIDRNFTGDGNPEQVAARLADYPRRDARGCRTLEHRGDIVGNGGYEHA